MQEVLWLLGHMARAKTNQHTQTLEAGRVRILLFSRLLWDVGQFLSFAEPRLRRREIRTFVHTPHAVRGRKKIHASIRWSDCSELLTVRTGAASLTLNQKEARPAHQAAQFLPRRRAGSPPLALPAASAGTARVGGPGFWETHFQRGGQLWPSLPCARGCV